MRLSTITLVSMLAVCGCSESTTPGDIVRSYDFVSLNGRPAGGFVTVGAYGLAVDAATIELKRDGTAISTLTYRYFLKSTPPGPTTTVVSDKFVGHYEINGTIIAVFFRDGDGADYQSVSDLEADPSLHAFQTWKSSGASLGGNLIYARVK